METKFYGKSVLMILTPIDSIVTAATRVKNFDRLLVLSAYAFDHPEFRSLTFDRSAAQSSSRAYACPTSNSYSWPGWSWRGNEIVTLSPIQLQ